MNLDWLIHAPWWAAVMVVLVGVAIFFSGNRRQDKGMQRLGIAIGILGVLIGVVAAIFPSDRQLMERRARAIIKAADAQDWKAMGDLLDPGTIAGTNASDNYRGRDRIVGIANANFAILHISGVSVLSTDTQQVDTDITVLMKMAVKSGDFFDRPIIVDCQFDFMRSGHTWKLNKITLLKIDNQNAEDVMPYHGALQ